MTQEQADQMKAKEQDRVKQSVEHKGGMGGFAGGRQNGQRRQGGNQEAPASDSNSTIN